MKKIVFSILWFVGGFLASKLVGELGYRLLNDGTTGVSLWRAAVPAILATATLVYCIYKGIKVIKNKPDMPLTKNIDSLNRAKKEFSPIQNETAFEYVAIFIVSIICIFYVYDILKMLKKILNVIDFL